MAAAVSEPNRLDRHLLVAAAISSLTEHPPVVVGGTAEQYWARDRYLETDLDLCGVLADRTAAAMIDLGFNRIGRHWELDGRFSVAVEVPESTLAGDEGRVIELPVRGQGVRLIGIDDLYLDRLRQATARPEGYEDRLAGAFALLATRSAEMDFRYIVECISVDAAANRLLDRMPYFHGHLARGLRQERTYPAVLRSLRRGLSRRPGPN